MENKHSWHSSQFNHFIQPVATTPPSHSEINNKPGAIYVSNIPLLPPQQQQQLDENGQPIKIRKKPGRKPNPASPALRKAQNRAAQRAFRERKERHLKDLEGTIRQLRDQRNSAIRELNQAKKKMDAFRAENWYLKGVVLTLQFVCLHHNIHIPTHSPYLTEDDLSEMAKTTPHVIEAYVNAYTKNNLDLKPTMASHFANHHEDDNDLDSTIMHFSKKKKRTQEENEGEEEEENDDHDDDDNDDDDMLDSEDMGNCFSVASEEQQQQQQQQQQESKEEDKASSISAIQRLRLELKLQSTLSNIGKRSALRLQPTILQLAIPHDPRIDLVPTPHMRDRMIIFRDQMDYDHCFSLLLNGAVYHGGDPTMSASWELPAEFFAEYWYLAINYDVSKTNTWRKLKGLPEINVKQQQNLEASVSPPQPQPLDNNNSSNDPVWTDDVFAQLTAGMPTLQPLDSNHLASGFDFGTAHPSMFDGYLLHRPNVQAADLSHPMFELLLKSSPESNHERSPNLDSMMELINSWSTDMQS